MYFIVHCFLVFLTHINDFPQCHFLAFVIHIIQPPEKQRLELQCA